jgi:ParB-like chromosome segregation protein Spo0J
MTRKSTTCYASAGSGEGASRRLAIEYRAVASLKLDLRNPRLHTRRQIRQIARSIRAFEFNVPIIIDAELNVIAGYGRVLACLEPGWTKVPTIRLEHLSEAQKRAFMIADNRLTETSVWDDVLLAEQLKELSGVPTLLGEGNITD